MLKDKVAIYHASQKPTGHSQFAILYQLLTTSYPTLILSKSMMESNLQMLSRRKRRGNICPLVSPLPKIEDPKIFSKLFCQQCLIECSQIPQTEASVLSSFTQMLPSAPMNPSFVTFLTPKKATNLRLEFTAETNWQLEHTHYISRDSLSYCFD